MDEFPKKEELTTAMHEEFVCNEISHQDFMLLSCFGAIKRGVSKKQALKEHDLDEEFYDANIERALSNEKF